MVWGGQSAERIAAQKKHDKIEIATCMGVPKTRAVLGCSSGSAHHVLAVAPLGKSGSTSDFILIFSPSLPMHVLDFVGARRIRQYSSGRDPTQSPTPRRRSVGAY